MIIEFAIRRKNKEMLQKKMLDLEILVLLMDNSCVTFQPKLFHDHVSSLFLILFRFMCHFLVFCCFPNFLSAPPKSYLDVSFYNIMHKRIHTCSFFCRIGLKNGIMIFAIVGPGVDIIFVSLNCNFCLPTSLCACASKKKEQSNPDYSEQ